MRPTDLRNLCWRDVLTHVTEDMVRVHLAWQAHGPGTTRQVAHLSGISLLTFRPRTTDLHALGLVELVGDKGAEGGIYAHVERANAEASGAWRTRADFRRRSPAPASEGPQRIGFVSVDDAVASMPPAEQAALGAKLLGRYGHLLKKREAAHGAEQMTLLPA